jgi:glycopeptide antibiotics resistance protein
MRLASVPAWGWWSLVVVAVSLPWIGFTDVPQWNRLTVVPFTDPEDKVTDLVANTALFVPFGFLFASRHPRPAAASFAYAALAAAGVSIGAEATQLFSTDRNPSATDVLYAVAGCAAGVATARALRLRT